MWGKKKKSYVAYNGFCRKAQCEFFWKGKVIFILSKTDFTRAPSAMDFTYSFSHIHKCQDMCVQVSWEGIIVPQGRGVSSCWVLIMSLEVLLDWQSLLIITNWILVVSFASSMSRDLLRSFAWLSSLALCKSKEKLLSLNVLCFLTWVFYGFKPVFQLSVTLSLWL